MNTWKLSSAAVLNSREKGKLRIRLSHCLTWNITLKAITLGTGRKTAAIFVKVLIWSIDTNCRSGKISVYVWTTKMNAVASTSTLRRVERYVPILWSSWTFRVWGGGWGTRGRRLAMALHSPTTQRFKHRIHKKAKILLRMILLRGQMFDYFSCTISAFFCCWHIRYLEGIALSNCAIPQ